MVALEGEWYKKWVMHYKLMGRPLMELMQSTLHWMGCQLKTWRLMLTLLKKKPHGRTAQNIAVALRTLSHIWKDVSKS